MKATNKEERDREGKYQQKITSIMEISRPYPDGQPYSDIILNHHTQPCIIIVSYLCKAPDQHDEKFSNA